METKHRKGDFLVNQEVLDLLLVSGAPNKERMLKQKVGEICSNYSLLASFGLAAIVVSRIESPVPIHELNHIKTAPALYLDKARKIYNAVDDLLPADAVATSADTHPKGGVEGKSLSMVLVKYEHPEFLSTYTERLEGLTPFVTKSFKQFRREDSLLMRAGIGVVPWRAKHKGERKLAGLVDLKNYVLYSKNPLPDEKAARDFLQMSAEIHTDCHGVKNNADLGRNLYIAGAVPQEDLIKFAIENKIGVEIRGRSDRPLESVDEIGDGFTGEVVLAMLQMVLGIPFTVNEPSTYIYAKNRRVRLLPNRRDRVLWSSEERGLVTQYVGAYIV